MLRTPKELIKALRDFDEVNLRHIATRRDKELLSAAVKAERPGERTKYDSFNSLLYVVATKLEKSGLSIEAAYHMATWMLAVSFDICIGEDGLLWLVEINNRVVFPVENQGYELPWQFRPKVKSEMVAFSPHLEDVINLEFGDKEELPPMEDIEQFIKLIPRDGVYLFVPRAMTKDIKEPIETVRFHDASKIVMDSIRRLGMNQGEIAKLQEQSRVHYRKVMNALRERVTINKDRPGQPLR